MAQSRRTEPIGRVLVTLEVAAVTAGEHQGVTVVVSRAGDDTTHELRWPMTQGIPTAGQMTDIAAYCGERVYREMIMQLGGQGVLPT